ncbi:MAG: L,D-transpeptidase, partial [Chthoniobacteraceae bacterium]
MRIRILLAILVSLQTFIVLQSALAAESPILVVSVAEQKLYVFDENGHKVASYRVSTSKYGLGDYRNSYATPTGQLEVAAKIGHGAEPGAVFHGCRQTGEICPPNAPGRDPIVTRILRLRGL